MPSSAPRAILADDAWDENWEGRRSEVNTRVVLEAETSTEAWLHLPDGSYLTWAKDPVGFRRS